jgi:site-specific DNA-methyltransferase (adenine-specific)
MTTPPRSNRNQTITLTEDEIAMYSKNLRQLTSPAVLDDVIDVIFNQDLFEALDYLPNRFADLIFLDPPYNLNKDFGVVKFAETHSNAYQDYLESWLPQVIAKLKPNGSLYLCGDWRSAGPIQHVLEKYLVLRNRITFEREKGRGAKSNWKNCSEDIWFATAGEDYYFNVDAVKLRKKVIAPYKVDGTPKDWEEEETGNYRLTHPSNLWTDLTIPFWSMPENTDHPTQKPEKALAKIIMASSREKDIIFDPFMGSGTTAVVAKKLNRRFVGIEINKEYTMWAQKRLEMAEHDKTIQGYKDGVFWERNSGIEQKRTKRK